MTTVTAAPALKIDIKHGLKTLDMLVRTISPNDKPPETIKIFHYGMAITRFLNHVDFLQILESIITLRVKHLKLKGLDFDHEEYGQKALSKSVLDQLKTSSLRELSLKGCESLTENLFLIFSAHNNIVTLKIRNCNLHLEKITKLSKFLETNYQLRTIDISHSPRSQFEPFTRCIGQVRQSMLERFDIAVSRLKVITDRNQNMHDNCLNGIRLILLAQKSKFRNCFTFIGRDCTRIIARYVFTTKFCLTWLRN